MRPAVLLATAALATLSACGTTVPQAAIQTGSSDGLGAPSAVTGAGTGSSPDGGTSPGTLPGTVTGSGGGSSTSTGGGTGVVPGSGPSSVATGTPTATVTRGGGPVRVGLLYISGADKAASALGISGLSTGDTEAQAKAIVGYLNAHAGLGGRRIDLRVAAMDSGAVASNPDQAHATACAKLTQDDKVSFVVSYVQLTSNQLSCYAKHQVVVLDDQSSVPDSAGARYSATFASPGEIALGRAATVLVDELWRTHWLTATSKVGTFVFDTPDGIELEAKYLLPALKKHGLAAVTARESAGADGANQGSTVIRFRSAGVDKVIPLGASPLFLMEAAESQGYRPQYAMTSTFGPGALFESAAPRGQLTGAAGIGWSKYLDIGAGTKPGAVSSNETLCFTIMSQNGQQTSSGTTKAFQVALCNDLMFLKAGADRYGIDGLLASVRNRGLAFPPADAFAVKLVNGRADGVAAVRDLAYQASCSCFNYTSGNVATP